MRVWLVGSGYWGSKVRATLEDLGHDVGVIDIKNGNTIEDINTADPVILATPVWEHYEQAKYLLQRGHDVYIEKPAAEHAHQVNDLIKLTKDQVVMVGHIFVHNPLIDDLKHMVENAPLGNLHFIHSERTNLGIYQTKTSTLLSLAPHDFSIIDYLAGDLNVTAAHGSYLSKNVQYDRVSVFGNNNLGVNWQIDVSWRWPLRRRIVTLSFEDGQAVWDEDQKNITIHYNTVFDRRLQLNQPSFEIKNQDTREPLAIELEHFFECVATRQKPKTDLNSALTVAMAIDRANAFL